MSQEGQGSKGGAGGEAAGRIDELDIIQWIRFDQTNEPDKFCSSNKREERRNKKRLKR